MNYTPNWNDSTKDGWNLEDLSITDDRGQLRDNFVVRPYPVATAGKPVDLTVTDQQVQYRWRHDPGKGATQLFVPDGWWQAGYSVNALPPLHCERSGLHLACQQPSPGEVELVLERKPH